MINFEPMKIAFLSTFFPYRGGIAQFNAALFRSLEKEHTVKAFNFSLQYPKLLFPGKSQFVAENDEVDQIPSQRILNSINPISYRSTVKEIKKFNPDLLIIGYWMPFMAPSLGFVAGKLKKHCKVVAIVHNATPHEKNKSDQQLNRYFLNRVDKIVALSEAVKKDIKNITPAKPIQVIPHPLYEHFGKKITKEEAANTLSIPANKKYLLFFGLIRKYKGLDVLLKALAHLPEDIHLVIAGEAYDKIETYQQIISEENIQNRVHLFNRYIPDHEVKSFFSLADVCVLPYKSATQSGVTAIAHYFNIPVIATKVGGLDEFIDNNKNGILIENADEKLLADTIANCYSAHLLPVFQQELERKKHFTWEDFKESLIAFVN